MKLYLRNKIWWYSIGSGENRFRQSTGCEDLQEAKERAIELSRIAVIKNDAERMAVAFAVAGMKRQQASSQIAQMLALADCWDKFPHIKNSFGKLLKGSTVKNARYCWLAFVRYAASRQVTMAAGVTEKFARDFLATRAPRSRVVTCRICKAMFNRIGIKPNPFDIKIQNPPTTHREPLNREQIKTLLTKVDDLAKGQQSKKNNAVEFAVFVRFLLYTGLRLGDAATARTDQVNWQEKTLTRIMAKTDRPVSFPLHPNLFKRLSDSDIYLFPAIAKQYIKRPDGLTKRFRRLFDSVGIVGEQQQFCAHCLRTTFASICAENAVPLAVIQSWLGHNSQTVTRIYARIEDMKAKKAAMAKFPEL